MTILLYSIRIEGIDLVEGLFKTFRPRAVVCSGCYRIIPCPLVDGLFVLWQVGKIHQFISYYHEIPVPVGYGIPENVGEPMEIPEDEIGILEVHEMYVLFVIRGG